MQEELKQQVQIFVDLAIQEAEGKDADEIKFTMTAEFTLKRDRKEVS
jgi:hypothetical protein